MEKMRNPRKRLSFVSDNSHGWLIVTPEELRTVGITKDDITPYSYRNITAELIALEEDVDMPVFLRAWEHMLGRPVEIVDAQEGSMVVRSWPSFGEKGHVERSKAAFTQSVKNEGEST